MCFHPKKCQVLSVGKFKKRLDHQYTLHGHTLEQVNQVKYLGALLSDDASWVPHIDAIINK